MRRNWFLAAMVICTVAFVAACGGGSSSSSSSASSAAASAPADSGSAPSSTEAATSAAESTTAESTDTAAASDTSAASDTTAGSDTAATGTAPAIDWQHPAGDVKGKKVTISGPETQSEADGFVAGLKPLGDATGVNIQYSGSRDFETQIALAVEAGKTPDIAIFPQPGKVREIADKIPALPDDIVQAVNASYDPYWGQLVTKDGKLLGIPNKSDLKSLVWYSPKAFADKGYAVPTTWDEFTALQDKIKADGGTPWCIGIESGDATGWAFTDWVEDFLLRMSGPDVYDKWVSHEIPFTDPQVKAAFEAVHTIWTTKGNVLQSPSEITTTSFADAGLPLLDGDCFLHRQANFYAANWRDAKAKIGADGDVNAFYLPPINDKFGVPVLGAGTYAVAFNNKPETLAVMHYLASADYVNNRIKTHVGGFLSANKFQDTSLYETDIERTFAKILVSSNPFRFDGSDQMPGAANSAFWKDATAYVAGTEDVDTALKNIDAAWPK